MALSVKNKNRLTGLLMLGACGAIFARTLMVMSSDFSEKEIASIEERIVESRKANKTEQ